MPAALIVLSLLVAGGQSPPDSDKPRLNLHASTLQPYVGQLVQLTLEIDLSPAQMAQPLRLAIPWLQREFGFSWQLSPEQWLCRQSGVSDGLAVRINNWPRSIRLQPTRRHGQAQYQLTWSLIVWEPDELTRGQIEFAPVYLETSQRPQGTFASKPLRLDVRKLPLPPATLPALNLNLGVGNYRMDASLAPASITLGESTILTLKVSGIGAMAQLPRPVLTSLSLFRQTDAWLVEDGTESWDAGREARYFRYVVQPRRLGTASIPPLFYTCFDPALGKYQTRATAELALTVNPIASKSVAAAAKYKPGSIPERLQLAPADEALASASWRITPLQSAAFVAFLPTLLAVLVFWRHYGRRRLGRQEHHWRSLAGRRAVHRLRLLKGDEVAAGAESILEEFLRQRFYMPASANGDADLLSVLQASDLSSEQLALARTFHERCDAVRFGPPMKPDDEDLRGLAERLITELDAS